MKFNAEPTRKNAVMSEGQHVVIRPARLADREAVWPLARDFATSFLPIRSAFETAFVDILGADDGLLLVAETDERLVGYLLATSHLTFLANGRVAWVEEVMVEADMRRARVGSALMEHAERWATDIDAAYLALASRRAGGFYLALGYEDSATFFKKSAKLRA